VAIAVAVMTRRYPPERRCAEDQLIPRWGNMDMAEHPAYYTPQQYARTSLSRPIPSSTRYAPNRGAPGSAPITLHEISATKRTATLTRTSTEEVYELKPARTTRRQHTLSDFAEVRPNKDRLIPSVFDGAGFNIHKQWELSVHDPTDSEDITPEQEAPRLLDPSDPVEDVPLPDSAHQDAYTAIEGQCGHCGSYHLGPKAWDPEQPTQADPCKGDDVKTCRCCVCPECSAKSIYYRQSKTPHYRCINCSNEFDAPYDPSHDPEGREANPPRKCLSCERTAW